MTGTLAVTAGRGEADPAGLGLGGSVRKEPAARHEALRDRHEALRTGKATGMAAAGAFDGPIGIIAAAIMARANPRPIGMRWSQESGMGSDGGGPAAPGWGGAPVVPACCRDPRSRTAPLRQHGYAPVAVLVTATM